MHRGQQFPGRPMTRIRHAPGILPDFIEQAARLLPPVRVFAQKRKKLIIRRVHGNSSTRGSAEAPPSVDEECLVGKRNAFGASVARGDIT